MNEMQINHTEIFDTEGAIFMSSKRNSKNCKVGIFGVPYDGTTSFKPGARFGPAAIREVSNGIETYCPALNHDLEEIEFVDFGSLKIPLGAPEPVIQKVQIATKLLLNNGIKPLILGGEHSITAGSVAAIANENPDLILIQLDAHADLRDKWQGSKFSHACSMRRCLEVLPSKKLFQIGIRSGTKREYEEMRTKNQLIQFSPGEEISHLAKILKPFIKCPIYLTIDLDWFDPSVLPGTGTPEAGGFYWQDFNKILEILKSHNLIAADIVELAPQIDQSGISSLLAAKVSRSIIMLLNR